MELKKVKEELEFLTNIEVEEIEYLLFKLLEPGKKKDKLEKEEEKFIKSNSQPKVETVIDSNFLEDWFNG